MKTQLMPHCLAAVTAASILMFSTGVHARGQAESTPPAKAQSAPRPTEEKEELTPGPYGMLINPNVHARAWPLLGVGVGLFTAAKLDRFTLGAGLDIFTPPGPMFLVPRVEAQVAFYRRPDRRVEVSVLAGYGWASAIGDERTTQVIPDFSWGPVRAGIGTRYWSNAALAVDFHVGADISPTRLFDFDGAEIGTKVSVSPFVRLGFTVAITKMKQ